MPRVIRSLLRSRTESAGSSCSSNSSTPHEMFASTNELLAKSGDLQLDSVVRNKAMLSAFLNFLQAQHAAENLTFFLMTEAFAMVFSEEKADRLGEPLDRDVVLKHAYGIYDRFLAKNAPSWVCVSPKIEQSIQKKLSHNSDTVTSKLFAVAQDETRETLERDCLPRFTKCVLDRTELIGFEYDEKVRQNMIQLLQQQVNSA